MTLEEWVEVARQLTLGLLQKMGIETEVEGSVKEGELYIEIKSDEGGILIGKQGSMIKKIGERARKDIEQLLGIRIFLNLFVRVAKNWRRDEDQLRLLGY